MDAAATRRAVHVMIALTTPAVRAVAVQESL